MELIPLQQALKTKFRTSLLHDVLTTLVLLQPANRFEGLGDWIYVAADQLLTNAEPYFVEITTALGFVPGFQGWLLANLEKTAPAHVDFDAAMDHLNQLSDDSILSALMEALRSRVIHLDIDCPELTPEPESLLPHLYEIQAYREQLNAPPLPITFGDLAALLTQPERFRRSLLDALLALGKVGYQQRYAEDRQRWQSATSYHQQKSYGTDFATIFKAVTGRPVHQRIENLAAKIKGVEWFPSCHVGAYVVYNLHRSTLRISYNAHLTPTVQGVPANLTSMYPIFKALADETRLQILSILRDGEEYSVSDLAYLLQLSPSNISRHLTFMAQTDLVSVRPEGTLRFYRLSTDGLREITENLQAITREDF